MNAPVVIEDNPPRNWLTIPEVCAYLKVTEAEWNGWRAAGDTPLHITAPDGHLCVRAFDLARWLDAHTVEPEAGPTAADVAAWHAQRARVARGPRRRVAWSWLRRVAPRYGGRDGQS